jgi:serine protease Do
MDEHWSEPRPEERHVPAVVEMPNAAIPAVLSPLPPPIGYETLRPPARSPSAIAWLLAMLILLMGIGYLAPRLAEEIQYALTRGRQRAEHEHAGNLLGPTTLADLSQASQMVALRIAPSVVIINVNGSDEQDEVQTDDELLKRFGPQTPEAMGQGSGVVVSEDGYILTNLHVVRDAKAIQVTLSDGRRLPATAIGVDNLTDLALIKVAADRLVPATWGDSDQLQVGSLIWTMGSPFGLERSVSFGILSAKNRGGIAGSPHQDFLQTDAAVNPGNSGGPLIDSTGRVVGINTAIVGQTYSGISFAIPSNVARDVAERLQSGGYVPRGWLGVELSAVSEAQAKALGLPAARGAFIARVVDDGRNSPAHQAGIVEGDVVVRWNGIEVLAPATLSQLVARTQIGTTVKIDVLRDGRATTLDVTVMERPRSFN